MNYTSARAIGGAIIQFILSAVAMPMILYFSNSDVANAKGILYHHCDLFCCYDSLLLALRGGM